MDDEIKLAIRAVTPKLTALRRELHAIPELGFQEHKTSALISERLRKIGLDVTTGIGKTGVVGVLKGASAGKTLMIRADFDGLPISEATGLSFTSTHPGVMHACGHDGHVSIALGAAEVLSKLKTRLRGNVVFAFQPAEETGRGALAMIADGLFDLVKADRVIGLHQANLVPLGQVRVKPEICMASIDTFAIKVIGKGGHGARPQLTVDPFVAAAQIVVAAQTLVSREIAPGEMGVVTFGQVYGGTARNVIPESVMLEGSVRAFTPEVRATIKDALPRIAAGAASALRARTEFDWLEGVPPGVNDSTVAAWMTGIAGRVVGKDNVAPGAPMTGSDDMAELLNRVPGCYFFLGSPKEGVEPGPHQPRFDFDEACLPIGSEIFVRAALDYLA